MIKVYYITKPVPEERHPLPECELLRGAESTDTILGRLLLRYALVRDHGISDGVIARTEAGKPYLRDHGDIHFSITHTASAVACAVSDSPVGIDAETVTKRDHGRVASRLFTMAEQEYAAGSPLRFTEIWVRKESYAKLTGTGLTHSIREMDVLTGMAVFTPVEIEGAVACVCTLDAAETEVHRVNITELTEDTL